MSRVIKVIARRQPTHDKRNEAVRICEISNDGTAKMYDIVTLNARKSNNLA